MEVEIVAQNEAFEVVVEKGSLKNSRNPPAAMRNKWTGKVIPFGKHTLMALLKHSGLVMGQGFTDANRTRPDLG